MRTTTTGITRLFGCMLLAGGLLVASCTSEEQQNGGNPTDPDGGDSGERREVLLTLKNKLTLQATTKGASGTQPGSKAGGTKAAIATAAENAIRTLDVYVFGSDTEDGDYTFQERFAYRADDNDELPAGATELSLDVLGVEGTETTGLLKLKRGLFVKFYCIANDMALIDPAGDGVTPVQPADFVPLVLSAPGEAGTKVATPGVPLESSFIGYHTRLLTADAKGDTLACPLAMSGALTTALDLTSFDNSARLQAGIKLTRLSARFDIQNVAKDSRFTLQSVSMGNGRLGSGFFPIRVYGDLPTAQPDELIACPARTFSGDKANTGLCAGAFYSYPSPQTDKGYLILKGLYKVNETESTEVSYQIPFRQTSGHGQEIYLDINNNHRYTVAITAADAYHLDATITVADWADDGRIEYKPENTPGEIVVGIPPAFAGETEYEEDTKTMSMSVKTSSMFEFAIATNSAIKITKVYSGGAMAQLQDWLTVSEPVITPGVTLSTYTFTASLTTPYLLGRYPRATLRLSNTIDGSESVLFVEPVAAPVPVETPQPPKAPNGSSDNPNSFDAATNTASLYRITDSQTQIKINCPDGVELESQPDWLNVEISAVVSTVTTATLTLNDRDIVVEGNTGIVTFRNKKNPDLKIDVTVSLLDAPVAPDFTSIGSDNTVTPENGTTPADILLKIAPGNKATVKVTSLDGVSVKITYPDGSPEWLSFSGASVTKAAVAPVSGSKGQPGNFVTRASTMTRVETLLFTPVESQLTGAQTATVTLTNLIGGKEKLLTITPSMQGGTVVKSTTSPSVPLQSVVKGKAITLYQLPGAATMSEMTIDVTSLGGSKLTTEGEGLTVSPAEHIANTATYVLKPALDADKNTDKADVTLHVKNYTNEEVTEAYAVTVLHSDLTGGGAMLLNATKDQTANVIVNSYEGFTIDPAKINWQGGSQWFKITSGTDNAAGANVKVVATATGATGTVRPATVSLTNKIVNGGDLQVTVTSGYAMPVLALTGTPVPVQNALTPGASASTVKLYRVAGSTLQFKATAIGGTKVTNPVGVDVTLNSGGGEFNTENTYTVTWDGSAISGSFQIVNSQDASKEQTVMVEMPDATITVASNIDVTAANSGDTNILVTSPAGCTASVTNWGGGSQWFNIKTSPEVGSSNLVISQVNNVSNTMKPATVTLTNKIAGGANTTVTVTPTGFVAPGLSATSGTLQNVINENTTALTFTVTAPVGGMGTASIDDPSTVSISQSGNTITVTAKKKGKTYIRVKNETDNTKVATYTIDVARDYQGKAVWKYNGFYIAPEDAGASSWDAASTYCSNKSGATWFVPSDVEYRTIIGSSGAGYGSAALHQEMKSKGIFVVGMYYWTSSAKGTDGYHFGFRNADMFVNYLSSPKSSSFQIRCVTQ